MEDSLVQANAMVLEAISQSPDRTVLGLLPLSEQDQREILGAVKQHIRGNFDLLFPVLRETPAAGACALALATSLSQEGGQIYPTWRNELSCEVRQNRMGELAALFEGTCINLGLVPGTVGEWSNAAPFIFQAAFRPYWAEALTRALRTTLRFIPVTDDDSYEHLKKFAEEMQRHIFNQPFLKAMLATNLGPILCQRIIRFYLGDNDLELPPHLRAPMREALQVISQDRFVRGPHLAFKEETGFLELVLPAQSHRILGDNAIWKVGERCYSARSERRLPVDCLPELESVPITLCGLASELQDATFKQDCRITKERPFRVFHKDNGREKGIDIDSSRLSIPSGNYLIVLHPDLKTIEEGEVTYQNALRWLYFESFHAMAPLVLALGDRQWMISPELEAGIYIDRVQSEWVDTEGTDPIYYNKLKVNAYLPIAVNSASYGSLKVELIGSGIARKCSLSSSKPSDNGFLVDCSEQISTFLNIVLSDAPAGIHLINFDLQGSFRRVTRSLWYWKGLKGASENSGLIWSDRPTNVDFNKLTGFRETENGLKYDQSMRLAFAQIFLTGPGTELRIPRPGVQVYLHDLENESSEILRNDQPLVVVPGDRRSLLFKSSGLDRWDLICGSTVIAVLDKNRPQRAFSHTGLVAQFGGVLVSAKRSDGAVVKLVGLYEPLLASTPQQEVDHGRKLVTWSFQVSRKNLSEIGFMAVDATEGAKALQFTPHSWNLASPGVQSSPSKGIHGIMVSIKQGRGDWLQVEATASMHDFDRSLIWLDFTARSTGTGPWLPLKCLEPHGTSDVRLIFRPIDNLEFSGTAPSAWKALLSGRLHSVLSTDPLLLTAPVLDEILSGCCSILNWKYPSSVWRADGAYLQGLSDQLADCHIFDSEDFCSIWWRHGVQELVSHAKASNAPVVRQFLFGCQPQAITWRGWATGDESQPDWISSSWSEFASVNSSNSLIDYVSQKYHDGRVAQDAFHALLNFSRVAAGQNCAFGRFLFKIFLEDPSSGLRSKYLKLLDYDVSPDAKSLLGANHLNWSLKALNRRTRAFEEASAGAADSNSLERILGKLRAFENNVTLMGGIRAKIGWPAELEYPWVPPSLNPWASRLSSVIFTLAALSNLAQNSEIELDEFVLQQKRLLSTPGTNENRQIRNGLNIVLSLGPELYAFYNLLFSIALKRP